MKKIKNKKLKSIIFISLIAVIVVPIFVFLIVGCGNIVDKKSQNLTNYTLNLDFDSSNNTLKGQEKVYYRNNGETVLNSLMFHLYPNAFRKDANYSPVSSTNYQKAYPNGFSEGKIVINNVKVNKVEQDVLINGSDENMLEVNFEDELFPDDYVTIEIDFVVTLPNCLHRFGYGDNTYNFGNFYPIASVYENGAFRQDNYGSNGDPFYSEMANYDVEISYDESFILASSGNQLTTTIENGKKITKIQAKTVRDFAFVLSDKFSVISKNAGNTTVFYYYYEDDNAEKSLQAGVDSINTFNNLFGKYPYSTYSVVKTNFIHGGMEYPNLVYISDDVEDYDEYLNVIIHETAHQWWYNLVGSDACNDAWMDEGLTEYSTLLFYRNNSGYNIEPSESINSSLSSYLLFSQIYESVYGSFDSSMDRNVNDYKGDLEYVYISYVKGVLFFDNLEDVVGERNFIKSLKYYFKQNEFGIASKEDMISAFEITSKRSLESFFNSWIEGKVILQGT